MRSVVGLAWIITASLPLTAQYVQQGPKLVGMPAIPPILGSGDQGLSVSLSADGNTALVGESDNAFDFGQEAIGRVFTRSGGVWSQQASLFATIAPVPFTPFQAVSVALSGDGGTAVVGGPPVPTGTATVFTRSGAVWTRQGPPLAGTGGIGNPQQGSAVSLSADGNTLIVGGPADNANLGAAWIFVRTGGVWTQQGGKLVGTGSIGSVMQGISVSLSADGNTAIIGGPGDNANTGAAWIFTRSGGVWSQQGGKLIGTGAVGNASQGRSVALSADGNTAIVGGPGDNGNTGAAWIFTRSGGTWTQQGNKLVGAGAVGAALQGFSASLSSDGNTAIIGGYGDNNNNGAAWVFTRQGEVWTQADKLVGVDTAPPPGEQQGWAVSLSGGGGTALVGSPGTVTSSPGGNIHGAARVFVAPVEGAPIPTISMAGLFSMALALAMIGWMVMRARG